MSNNSAQSSLRAAAAVLAAETGEDVSRPLELIEGGASTQAAAELARLAEHSTPDAVFWQELSTALDALGVWPDDPEHGRVRRLVQRRLTPSLGPRAAAFLRAMIAAVLGGALLGPVFGFVLVVAVPLLDGTPRTDPAQTAEGLVVIGVWSVLLGLPLGALTGLVVAPIAWLVAVSTHTLAWPLRRVLLAAVSGVAGMVPPYLSLGLPIASLAAGVLVAAAVYLRAPRALRTLPGVPITSKSR